MTLFKKKIGKNQIPESISKFLNTEGLAEDEIARLEAEAILEKYDKESAYRNKLPRNVSNAISAMLILFSLFQLYTTIWTIPIQKLRPTHLAFVLILVFCFIQRPGGCAKMRLLGMMPY